MGRIVVGVDGSQCAEEALDWALEEAGNRRLDVEVVLAWQVPAIALATPVPYESLDPEGRLAAEAHVTASEIVDAARSRGAVPAGTTVTSRAPEGPAARVLVEAAEDAPLLVVGRKGHGGFSRLLMGSVATSALHQARCPVALVPADWRAPGDEAGSPAAGLGPRVVVGVDGSPGSRSALRLAAATARQRGVALVAVYVWQLAALSPVVARESGYTPPLAEYEAAAERILSGALDEVRADLASLSVTPLVVRAAAVRGLMDAARGADLLVVGSRGHGGFAGLLLGSVSSQVATHAPCPVLVVRQDEERLEEAS
jgi:nucleotide-binding universal stress UspA family protein